PRAGAGGGVPRRADRRGGDDAGGDARVAGPADGVELLPGRAAGAAQAPVAGQLQAGGRRVARRSAEADGIQRHGAGGLNSGRRRSSASRPGRLVRSRWIGVTAILPSAMTRKSVPGSSWYEGSSP